MIRTAIASIPLLVAVGVGCNSPSSTSSARGSTTPADAGRAPAPGATTPPAGSSAAESPTPDAAPRAATDSAGAQGGADDPRIQEIRARYQAIQARKDLKRSDLRFECAGGEGRGELRVYTADGAIQKAEISAGDAGHGEFTYQFYYDEGKLVFALHGDGSWFFDERGTVDKPTTTSSVTQRRYYVHEGEPVLCIKKYAKGPTENLGSLLEQAPNQPDDCSGAKKTQQVASAALSGAGAKATEELKKLLCRL